MKRVGPGDFARIAERQGDHPHLVIPFHALMSGRCETWASGNSIIIRASYIADEPFVYGDDVEGIAECLATLNDWTMVTVDPDIATPLASVLSSRLGIPFFLNSDNYFAQSSPRASDTNEGLRQLSLADADLLACCPRQIQGGNREWAERLLTEGLAIAAFEGDQIVCVMHAYCITPRFADVSANTLPEYRRKGYARRAGAMLCDLIRKRERIPTWSTSGENVASQELAGNLGFERIMTRSYVSRIDPGVKLLA